MILFRAKPPVDPDEYEWLLACFSWLQAVLPAGKTRPELVVSSHPALRGAQSAPELFAAVRSLMQMDDWACRLVCVADDFNPNDMRVVREGSHACGTFSVENGEAVIRYSSAMLDDREGLAATFAHELAHYLLAGVGDPPGGPDLMEHSTDCAAVYCGFGVLLANNAREFGQWQSGDWHGWQSQARGYLSERALVTATAMFAALHGHQADAAKRDLKDYLRKDFAKAEKAVRQDYPDFPAALAALDLAEWNYD